jgi:hypothetical protein
VFSNNLSIDRQGVDALQLDDNPAASLIAHLDRIAADDFYDNAGDRLSSNVEREAVSFSLRSRSSRNT